MNCFGVVPKILSICALLMAAACSEKPIAPATQPGSQTAVPQAGASAPPMAASGTAASIPVAGMTASQAGNGATAGKAGGPTAGSTSAHATDDPGEDEPSEDSGNATPRDRTPRPAPVVSAPIELGTLAGPDMKHADPQLKFYGTDMGITYEHKGKLVTLFGDTWSTPRQICDSPEPHNDDTIGYMPVEYSGGMPEIHFLARQDSAADVRHIELMRGTESLSLGSIQAPLAGFSDGERAYALFGRMSTLDCNAPFAKGNQACPTDDGFFCSKRLGVCDPPLLTFPAVCDATAPTACFPGQTCKATPLCVDPSSSQNADGAFESEERSVAHTIEWGVANEDSPEKYTSILAFPTNKFAFPAARTVANFTGKIDGNEYGAGKQTLLVWGRPGLTAEHNRDGYLYLMQHRLPLETGEDGKLKFEPKYFAGVDPETGQPKWTDRQSQAQGIALDGRENGDPHESVHIMMNMGVNWLPAPINKWALMYGGDMADYLLLDAATARSQRAPGSIWIRFADHPWGPFSPPVPALSPGYASRPKDPYGPGGFMFSDKCADSGMLMCANSDPVRPGCDIAPVDPGRLYAPNIIDNYTKPNANGGVDIIWNVSIWNPYAVKVFKTSINPPDAPRPQDELADTKALLSLANWKGLPELKTNHHYTQQTSYDRGTEDNTYPLTNHGNRDFSNFICASRDAEISQNQLSPWKFDMPSCPETYVRGAVMARYEGAGHMVRMWLGMQSLLFGPADNEVLRIYVDDDQRPRVDVPLREVLDGRAGEIFAPPFGAGSQSRMAWYYPVSFRKKLIVAIDRLGELDTYFYHCDVVWDEPSDTPLSSERNPAREAAIAQLGANIRPAGTQPLLNDPINVSLAGGAKQNIKLMGPATIHEFALRIPTAQTAALARTRMRVRWEGSADPAIDLTLADFYGGSVPPDRASHALSGMVEGPDRLLAVKLPMPFRGEANIELENTGTNPVAFVMRLAGERAVPENDWGHLYTQRTETLGPTTDALRTAIKIDGRGRLVGTCTEVEGHADPNAGIQYDHLNLLEGDPKVTIDGTLVINGTGTEETVDDVFYFVDAPYAHAFAQTWNVFTDPNRPPGRASFCTWNVLGRELDFQKSLEMTYELGGSANPSIVEKHKTVSYYYLAK